MLQGKCGGNLQPWEKGFIIHALGDTFAHTYEKGNERYAYPSPGGHGSAGHWPDAISSYFAGYEEYIRALYSDLAVSGTYFGANGVPTDPKGLLGSLLNLGISFQNNPTKSGWPIDTGDAELAREAAAISALAKANRYTGSYDPAVGGTDPTMMSPTVMQVLRLINKIRSCAGESPIPEPNGGAGLGIKLSDRNEQLIECGRGLEPLPQE